MMIGFFLITKKLIFSGFLVWKKTQWSTVEAANKNKLKAVFVRFWGLLDFINGQNSYLYLFISPTSNPWIYFPSLKGENVNIWSLEG